LDQLGQLAHQDLKGQPELLELQVLKVLKVQQEPLVIQVHKVLKAQLVLQV
jgi:hypothetical protein